MRVFILTLLFSLIYESNAVRLQLSNGIIEGYSVRVGKHKVNVFKNVPFAEPPVGDLRFQTPHPKRPWHGVRDGTKYSRPCVSNTTFTTSPQTNVSEDCLYLNVFADERCLREACPILYYIHGGNFYYDSAIMFNDTQIISKYASDKMVFVIPAYRLGIFGFMDLGRELDDAPYNVGMYDLILALRWVQKEGHRVGGNVKKITCMGNSGGASSVEYLMATPALEPGVFEKVIISSGRMELAPHMNLIVTNMTADGVNCNKNDNGTELTIEEKLACLKQRSAKELSDATQATENEWTESGPQSDKVLFPGQSYSELLNRYFKAVPMLITTTTKETVEKPRNRSPPSICRIFFSMFGYTSNEAAERCVEYYKENNIDYIFRDTFHAIAVKLAIENTRRGEPSFVGVFGQVDHDKHANDLTYFFGLHPIANMTADDKLMDAYYPNMIKQFIKSGRPEPDWEPANLRGENYYYLDFETNKSIIPHFLKGEIYDKERVDFWLHDLALIEWNATQNSNETSDHSRLFQQLLQVPANNNELLIGRNSTQKMFAITSSQVWVAFWTILSLAIILATIILIMTASRLMFNYQSTRGYSLTTAGEGTKILSRNVRKYV